MKSEKNLKKLVVATFQSMPQYEQQKSELPENSFALVGTTHDEWVVAFKGNREWNRDQSICTLPDRWAMMAVEYTRGEEKGVAFYPRFCRGSKKSISFVGLDSFYDYLVTDQNEVRFLGNANNAVINKIHWK